MTLLDRFHAWLERAHEHPTLDEEQAASTLYPDRREPAILEVGPRGTAPPGTFEEASDA